MLHKVLVGGFVGESNDQEIAAAVGQIREQYRILGICAISPQRSSMHNSSQLAKKPLSSIERPKQRDRLTFICDESAKLVVPVGPRFQVDVPSWTHPFSKNTVTIDNDSKNPKWDGILIWSLKGKIQDVDDNTIVGRGRHEMCPCLFPGTIECVRRHILDKILQLKIDLGPAYWRWKFDDMGDDASKQWNREEQKKFEYTVKTNENFMKAALECFPNRSKRSIVSYYYNVYIPRRISAQTRSRCEEIDTDDETEEIPHVKMTRKRFQANIVTSNSSKYIKTTYLAVHL